MFFLSETDHFSFFFRISWDISVEGHLNWCSTVWLCKVALETRVTTSRRTCIKLVETLMSYLLSAGSLAACWCLREDHSGRTARINTLQVASISEMALRLRLAVAITSSCWAEFPAATALAVAVVMPLVIRVNSSGVVDFSGTSLDWKSWSDESYMSCNTVGDAFL